MWLIKSAFPLSYPSSCISLPVFFCFSWHLIDSFISPVICLIISPPGPTPPCPEGVNCRVERALVQAGRGLLPCHLPRTDSSVFCERLWRLVCQDWLMDNRAARTKLHKGFLWMGDDDGAGGYDKYKRKRWRKWCVRPESLRPKLPSSPSETLDYRKSWKWHWDWTKLQMILTPACILVLIT